MFFLNKSHATESNVLKKAGAADHAHGKVHSGERHSHCESRESANHLFFHATFEPTRWFAPPPTL